MSISRFGGSSIFYCIAAVIFCSTFVWTENLCRNRLNPTNPLIIEMNYRRDINLTSCQLLRRKYPTLCRRKDVSDYLCCRSCKLITGQSCLDDFQKPESSLIHLDKFETCKLYARKDPCRCQYKDAQTTCCISCSKVDYSQLDCKCRDIFNRVLRPAYLIEINVRQGDTWVKNGEMLMSCKDFVAWYPNFCGGAANFKIFSQYCCKSCQGVDYTCFDNLSWRANVTMETGNSTISCQNCTCHEIQRTSKSLMRFTCRKDVTGSYSTGSYSVQSNIQQTARHACCHQCKRQGYPKPENYSGLSKGLKAWANIHYMSSVFGLFL